MTSQSEFTTTGEQVGNVFYVAPNGHRYEPGQTFPQISGRADEGVDSGTSVNASYWVAIKPNKTREVLGRSNGPRSRDSHKNADALLVDYPNAEVYYIRGIWRDHSTSIKTWMNYDWTVSTEIVNQYGYLPKWKAHVGRFAHSFDSLPSFESFNQLSAAQKVTAFRVGQTIAGHAWERLGFWTSYDASLSDDWKLPIVIDPIRKAVDAVCFECQSESAARRLALTINASLFDAKLAQGHIHGTDRTVNPWIPGDLLTIVPEPDEETTLETVLSRLVYSFNSARDYYDSHVAHEVIEHEHEE